MGALKLDQNLILKKLDNLPTLPSIVYELSRIINDPMSSTNEVVKILENDLALTSQVLKMANSAYYAIPGGAATLGRAIGFLGFDTVNQLVLSSSIISALKAKGTNDFNINHFWQHSIGVGIAAETIAKYTKHPLPSDLFTCGLVHDIGKLAIYLTDPDAFLSLISFARENKMSIDEAEGTLDFPQHTEIGRLLAEKWLLPRQIQAAVSFHHQSDYKKRGGISNDLGRIVDTVILSNLIIHAQKFGNSGHEMVMPPTKELTIRLMIDSKVDFKPLANEIEVQLERATEFIRIIGGAS